MSHLDGGLGALWQVLGDADLDVAAVRVLDVDELLALGGVSLRHPALVVVTQLLQWLVVDLDGGVDAARALEVLARAHRLQAALQSTNTSHTHVTSTRSPRPSSPPSGCPAVNQNHKHVQHSLNHHAVLATQIVKYTVRSCVHYTIINIVQLLL